MDQNERHIIDDLFDRLRKAEEQAEPRDPDAEALIARHVARQPASSYYMAQAIVVQQEALRRAQTKIQELERRLAERRSGGFLSGLFGDDEPRPPVRQPAASGALEALAATSPPLAAASLRARCRPRSAWPAAF